MPDTASLGTAVGRPAWFDLAVDLSALALWDWDLATDRIRWDGRGTEILGYAPEAIGGIEDFSSRIHPEDQDAFGDFRTGARNGSTTALETGFRFRSPDGRWRPVVGRARVVRDGAGQGLSVQGVLIEQTDRPAVDDRTTLLLGELQHRIKNMVAIIRSMAHRTRENSADLDTFSAHFEGRLGAFSRTHSALARTAQGEVSLEEMIREELRQHAGPHDEPWTLTGPPVYLRQKVAEQMALAIHELATNAIKFGALSVAGGRIDVTWTLGDAGRLLFDWVETSAIALPPMGDSGFGTEIIERALPYQLGAETRLTFMPTGLHCHIAVPVDGRTGP